MTLIIRLGLVPTLLAAAAIYTILTSEGAWEAFSAGLLAVMAVGSFIALRLFTMASMYEKQIEPPWEDLAVASITGNEVKSEYAVKVTVIARDALMALHAYEPEEAESLLVRLRDAHAVMGEKLP